MRAQVEHVEQQPLGEHLAGHTLADDAARLHDDEAVAVARCELEVVQHGDDRAARVVAQARDELEHLHGVRHVDVYVLAQVLHNWPDAEAALILSRVADAVGTGRIAVIERISGPDAHDHDVEFDLLMFAAFGGGERAVDEYAALARGAGLELTSTMPLADDLHLIELRRAGG